MAPVAVPDAYTLLRFCQQSPDNNCKLLANISDYRLAESNCPPDGAWPDGCRNNPDPDDPGPSLDAERDVDLHHRIRLNHEYLQGGAAPDAAPMRLDHDRYAEDTESGVSRTWRYEQDFERWQQESLLPPDSSATEPAKLLGTLWLHAVSRVGWDDESLGTGLHGPMLANHHQHDFAPGARGCGWASAIRAIQKPFFLWLTKPDPPAGVWRRWDAVRVETSWVARTDAGEWVALAGDGSIGQPMTEALGAALRQRVADESLVWTSSVEPLALLGSDASFPVAMALRAEGGHEIVERVTTDGAVLYSESDLAWCTDESIVCPSCASGHCMSTVPFAAGACCLQACETRGDCHSLYCDAMLGQCAWPPAAGSPHARDYVPVLTRTLRGLFVVGGDDVESGQPTGEVWWLGNGSEQWWQLDTGAYVPSKVLAATYSFASHSLYVLDVEESQPEAVPDPKPGKAWMCHVPPDNPDAAHSLLVASQSVGAHLAHGDSLGPCPVRTARLVALHVPSGAPTRLASWQPRPSVDRHWLVVDRDGALLLAASSSQRHRHVIARIAVGDSAGTLEALRIGSRALRLAPIADGAGYALLLETEDGILRKRLGTLSNDAGTWAALEAEL